MTKLRTIHLLWESVFGGEVKEVVGAYSDPGDANKAKLRHQNSPNHRFDEFYYVTQVELVDLEGK